MTDASITGILKAGLEMETEGRRVYEEAAAKTSHHFAKEMFLSLASDEKRHADWFRRMAESLGAGEDLMREAAPEAFVNHIRGVFSDMRQRIEGAKASVDDIAAIDIALGMEEKSYEMYAQAAKGTSSDAARNVLETIAKEENNHYLILQDVRLYLTDPEKWNIKEENPLIDG